MIPRRSNVRCDWDHEGGCAGRVRVIDEVEGGRDTRCSRCGVGVYESGYYGFVQPLCAACYGAPNLIPATSPAHTDSTCGKDVSETTGKP